MSPLSILSDDALIAQFIQGNTTALNKLITRYDKKLLGYLLALTRQQDIAHDLKQDTVCKIVETIQKGKYAMNGAFNQWALRIAYNTFVNYYRQLQRFPPVIDVEQIQVPGCDYVSPFPNETTDRIMRLIDTLDQRTKEMLLLFYFKKLKLREIADITNIPINTCKGMLVRARNNFAEVYKKTA